MNADAPLLFFASGVGGLSVLEPTRALLPNAPIVYAADSAGFPYGKRTEAELAARVPALLGRLVERFRPRLAVIARPYDGGLTKLDLLTQKAVGRVMQAGNSIGGAISEDGRLVAVANYEPGGVRIFDAETLVRMGGAPAREDEPATRQAQR